MLATLVDTHALLKVVAYSVITALGLTVVFSFGIVGVTRYDDRRRGGEGGLAYALLALICGLIVTGVIVEAIVIMARK